MGGVCGPRARAARFVVTGGKGSHVKLRKGSHVVILPQHSEVAPGTMRSILKQAGIDAGALRDAL